MDEWLNLRTLLCAAQCLHLERRHLRSGTTTFDKFPGQQQSAINHHPLLSKNEQWRKCMRIVRQLETKFKQDTSMILGSVYARQYINAQRTSLVCLTYQTWLMIVIGGYNQTNDNSLYIFIVCCSSWLSSPVLWIFEILIIWFCHSKTQNTPKPISDSGCPSIWWICEHKFKMPQK
jgi:hypothetical protein